jgi:hypothetical protein
VGGNPVEGVVDRPGRDSSRRSVDVEAQQGHDIQLDLGMHAVEVLKERGRRDPPTDDIDA